MLVVEGCTVSSSLSSVHVEVWSEAAPDGPHPPEVGNVVVSQGHMVRVFVVVVVTVISACT